MSANQPLENEDAQLALIFNGEIYNSPELRQRCEAKGHRFRSRSDGEVILHLWEDEGIGALRRLNGIFALALLDRRTGRIVLARDPLGVKPLFWSTDGPSLWFASELRALQAAGAPMGKSDLVGLAQFLTFLWIPDPRTPYADAHSLLPGEALFWESGRIRREQYADLVAESVDSETLSSAAARTEVRERVSQAVRGQLLSDVEIGVLASGGIDSSLLWWAADDVLSRAFTIDWSSDDSSEGLHEDVDAVRELTRCLRTPVEYLKGDVVDVEALLPSGDLFADPAVDLCRMIAQKAHERGFKVLLSGQGGDEVFAGYRRHILGPAAARMPSLRLSHKLADVLTRSSSQSTSIEYFSRFARASSHRDPLASYLTLCSYSDAPDRAAALGCTETEVSDDVVLNRHRQVFEAMPAEWSFLRRFRALDLAVYMPGLGLAYADRAGMQHSVEIRVPWLDLDLVRWALRLPDDALVRGRHGKWLTRSLAAEVMPRSVVERPKRGFAAPAQFLRDSSGSVGDRGFRQARYFSTARAVLDKWLAVNGQAV